MSKTLLEVYEELQKTYQNIKAEVLVSEILDKSDLDLSDIDILNQGTFSRAYRRDVIETKLDTHSKNNDKIQILLARNGIYDILPEGMFHEPVKLKKDIPYNELRKTQKQQERDARKFFAPLENEFFLQKLFIENKEKELINDFSNLNANFLEQFWKIDPLLPDEYKTKLLQLLPYANQMAGKKDLIARILEKILEEKVEIGHTFKKLSSPISEEKHDSLSVDFVLELKESEISYPHWIIKIGPISPKKANRYISDGNATKFIAIFCDYFIPIEIEHQVNFSFENANDDFILDETNTPIMGLTTKL